MLRIAFASLLAGLLALLAPSAATAGYPEKPIRLLVPFAPGGGTDLLCRALQDKMDRALGVSVIIDNRAGAGGTIGVTLAARAVPDGYTFLVTSASYTFAPSLYKNLSYDAIKDFKPLSMLTTQPLILGVHPSIPVRSVKELIALAKARPGKLNYASGGNGTNFHVAAELFKHQTGTQIAHVPYKGGGPALASVLGGETDITIASLGAALPHVNSGRVRVLAITSAERSSLMPHIPTVAESGVRDYVFTSWVGALVPAATPPAIVATLNSIVVKAVRSPEVANRLVSDGTQIIGSSPEQFAALIRSEIPRWAKVVKAGNIQPL